MPRGVVCGRISPPSAASRVAALEDPEIHLGPEVRLPDAEGHGPARASPDFGHPRDLGRNAFIVLACSFETWRHLVHAPLLAAKYVGDREQPLVGPGARNETTVGHTIQQRAAGREAERTGSHRFVHGVDHRRDLVARSGRLVHRAVAHHVVAHRGVSDHAADVDPLRQTVDRGQVLAVAAPVPRQAVENARGGNVLDRLHEPGEVVAVVGCRARTSRRKCRAPPTSLRASTTTSRAGPSGSAHRGGCGCRRTRV